MINLIKQTNRTVLFDEVNPEKLNLLTLIGDSREKDSLDDETIKTKVIAIWKEVKKKIEKHRIIW